MKNWKRICFTILFIQFSSRLHYGQTSKCPESANTVQVVDTCPTTEAEVNEAAKHKNCSFYAQSQNCTAASRFKYHCVINVFVNETISVCAPVRFIKGYCTEYNIQGQVIQDFYKYPCTEHSPNCPERYLSTEAYKYPSCYELVYANQAGHKDGDSGTLSHWLIIGIVVPFIIATGVAVFLLFYFKRRKRNRQQENVFQLMEAVPLVPEVGHAEIQNPEIEGKLQTEELHEASLENSQQQSDDQPPESKHLEEEEEEGQSPGMSISMDTATDSSLLVLRKDQETLAEENLEDTRKYLRNYKIFDRYYVETKIYKDAKSFIERNGVVIITGPPGCGKTNAAVHLMLTYVQKKDNWDIRKISSCKDFSFVRSSESRSTLFFIDNLSFENSFVYELKEWWQELDKVFENHIKRFKGTNGMSKEGKVQLLITARSKVIEKACQFMKRIPPVFKEDYVIDVAISSSASNKTGRQMIHLTDEEKEEIFRRQLDFANKELQIDLQSCDEKFMKEIKLAEGPIGFPLCAHLYACKKEYRKRGSRFFTHPIDILRTQIEKEIESDSSNRTETIFFLLFLYEWHLKTKDSHERLNIRNSESCKAFLKKISKDLLDQFITLNFDKLGDTGKRLAGAFLREMEVGSAIYKFTHDSVFDAVGSYFCDKYFKQTVQWFPLEILRNQEFLSLNNEKCHILALRLLYEAFNRKLAQIFSCTVFHLDSFADCFIKELSKRKQNMITMFFNVNDESSHVGLPVTFWASKNNLHYLTHMMLSMTRENNCGYEYHLFMSLLGECASRDENLLTKIESNMHGAVDELKKKVAAFEDDNGNSILHIVIESPRGDEDASEVIKALIDTKGVKINHRNGQNITPIMVAVRCTTKRTKLIEELVKANAHMKYKDVDGSTVFHHCLSSENDDRICSNTIKTLLESGTLIKINTDDNKGETPLNIAAKQNRFSRVLSILALLKNDDISTDTSNLDGYSPIQNTLLNLHGDDFLISLERCARIAIFMVYGVSPEHQADEKESSKAENDDEKEDKRFRTEGKEVKDKGKNAIDMCRELQLEHEESILLCSKDQDKMASVLEDVRRAIKTKHTQKEKYEVQNPRNKISRRLLREIEEAVNLLAGTKFD